MQQTAYVWHVYSCPKEAAPSLRLLSSPNTFLTLCPETSFTVFGVRTTQGARGLAQTCPPRALPRNPAAPRFVVSKRGHHGRWYRAAFLSSLRDLVPSLLDLPRTYVRGYIMSPLCGCGGSGRSGRGERTAEGVVAGQENLLMPAAGMPTLRTPRSVGQPGSWQCTREQAWTSPRAIESAGARKKVETIDAGARLALLGGADEGVRPYINVARKQKPGSGGEHRDPGWLFRIGGERRGRVSGGPVWARTAGERIHSPSQRTPACSGAGSRYGTAISIATLYFFWASRM